MTEELAQEFVRLGNEFRAAEERRVRRKAIDALKQEEGLRQDAIKELREEERDRRKAIEDEERRKAIEEAEDEEETLFWSKIAMLEQMVITDPALGSAKRMFREGVEHQLKLIRYVVAMRQMLLDGWTLDEFDDWWREEEKKW